MIDGMGEINAVVAHEDAEVGIVGEADVVLAGAVEAIEIWPAGRFDEEEAPKHDDVDLLFDTHSGLPTGPA